MTVQTAIAVLDGLHAAGALSDWEHADAVRTCEARAVIYGPDAKLDPHKIVHELRYPPMFYGTAN